MMIFATIFASVCLVGCSGGGNGSASDGGQSSSLPAETGADVKYNIVLSATELTLEAGESEILYASYGTEKVKFESTDESIATVTDDGTVTAKAAGTAYIKVTAGGKEKICKVTVEKIVWTVEIEGEKTITAANSLNKEFYATVYKNGEKTSAVAEWIIDGGASVYADDNVARAYITSVGTYTLTASYKGATATVVITVISE